MAGPAIGGALIATAGVVPCFAVASAGFVIALGALVALRPRNLAVSEPLPREPGQLRQGLRYVRSQPALLIPLAAMAVVGTLAFNFPVLLPLMARFEFHAGRGDVRRAGRRHGRRRGDRLAAQRRPQRKPSLADLGLLALAFGTFTALLVAAPSLPLAFAALVGVGAASAAFAATTNALLQLRAAPAGPRPRDGHVQRGLPGLHAAGRADRGLGGRARRRPGGLRGGRRRHAADRRGDPLLAGPQATAWLSSARARATTLSARWAGTSS